MNEAEANQNMGKRCPQCGATLPSGVLEGLCPACLLKEGTAETAAPPEAAPFQPPAVDEVARMFPQLEILALIGKGGMGAVYKARQPALDRIVALKILPPQTASDPGFAERFNREARALAKLNHPNIIAVHEFGQVNGLPFFIMEFVDGLNLRQLEQAGKLSPREALQIVPQICEALQFAHDEGVVHRDIKPENILLDKKGRVKIADFGIAKILGKSATVSESMEKGGAPQPAAGAPPITEVGGIIGTPQYMAPEQMEKPQSVDHRADIFSLGVVFYEMLTGELPLGKFARPSLKAQVDVRLDEVVLRALEREPERRYQHVSQVKTAVETISGTAAPPPPVDAAALTREVLARDCALNIGSCLRRGWALVRSDFWPIVGITVLILALLALAGSVGGSFQSSSAGVNETHTTSALAILVWGPLMGGLSLYYLKKIRGQPANVETAFSGFSNRFLHLFLAGFVTWVLTFLGFVCFILPGIFLAVIWWFTLTLVIDKRLDFWSAMELSRKVTTRHWWKFLGFWLVVLLMYAVGLAFLGVGFFISAPVAMIAATFAYEDIFGAGAHAGNQPAAAVGPSGTAVLPGSPAKPPQSGGGFWKPVVAGLTAVLLFVGLLVGTSLYRRAKGHGYQASHRGVTAIPSVPPIQPDGNSPTPGTDADLPATDDSWRLQTPDFAMLDRVPPQVRILPTKFAQPGGCGAVGGKMMGIGVPVEAIAQVAYSSPGENNWKPTRTIVSPEVKRDRYDFIANLPEGSWKALQQELKRRLGVVGSVETRDTNVLLLTVRRSDALGLKPSAYPTRGKGGSHWADDIFSGTNYDFSEKALLQEMKRRLGVAGTVETRDTNVFLLTVRHPDPPGLKTGADPTRGKGGSHWADDSFSCTNYDISDLASFLENYLQMPVVDETGFTNNFDIDLTWNKDDPKPAGLKQALLDQLGLELVPARKSIAMLIVEPDNDAPTAGQDERKAAVSSEQQKLAYENLMDRLDAATTISGNQEKDKAMAGVAIDAAKAGEAGLAKTSLGRIHITRLHDEAAREAARQLAQRGLRKQAIEIAKSIYENRLRDQTLSELAR